MSKFIYSLKQSFMQIRRNKGMTATSVFAITAMLIILGVFMMLIININTAAESIKGDYNNIEVFFSNETTEDQINATKAEVEKWDDVNSVTYRPKSKALELLKTRWGENAYLLEGLGSNPLPNSLVITVDNLEQADQVAKKAESISGAEDVKYYKDTVDKLLKVTQGFQIGALIIIAFLVIVSTVVVSNTIKLTVMNRADEIVIMKYIGATNWFIRAPFLLEGIIIGIISAILSSVIVIGLYGSVVSAFGTMMLSMLSTPMVPVGFVGFNLVLIFISLGVSIGAWGSIISMRRFLDTK